MISSPTILYMSTFFFSMIAMELSLETITREFASSLHESLSSAVTLFQFGFCFLLPFLIQNVTGASSKGDRKETISSKSSSSSSDFPRSIREIQPYLILSGLIFGATGLGTRALLYVSYPTKVVFKSAKLIPTMIVSSFCGNNKNGQSYQVMDYIAAALISLGAAGYTYRSGSSVSNVDDSFIGIALLIISLFCDAAVPNVQQRFMSSSSSSSSVLPSHNTYNHTSNTNKNAIQFPSDLSPSTVMLNTNLVGFLLLGFYMLFNGSLLFILKTSAQNTKFFFLLNLVGSSQAVAVFAYTKLIDSSGSVMAVFVATLRKIVTVFLSYLIYPKPLENIHILGGCSVFIGVMINSYNKSKNKKKKQRENDKNQHDK